MTPTPDNPAAPIDLGTATPVAQRRIEYRQLDECLPADRNPKRHDLPGIIASLQRFGYVELIAEDARTGRLVAGHGRLEGLAALRDSGEQAPSGVVVDAAGAWRVPVLLGWASADDEEAQAYLLASNGLTIAGGWDDEELAALLQDAAANTEGLVGTGFDPTDVDLLLAGLHAGGPTDPDEEWAGMPEFSQADLTGKYATTIHFLTEEDAVRFWKEVLGQGTPRRTTWWPAHDGFEGSSQKLAYVAEEDDAPAAPVPDLHPVEESG